MKSPLTLYKFYRNNYFFESKPTLKPPYGMHATEINCLSNVMNFNYKFSGIFLVIISRILYVCFKNKSTQKYPLSSEKHFCLLDLNQPHVKFEILNTSMSKG